MSFALIRKTRYAPEAALISFVPRSRYCDERRTLIFAVRSAARKRRRRNEGRGKKKKRKKLKRKKKKISGEIRRMVMSPAFRRDASNFTGFQSWSRIFFVRSVSSDGFLLPSLRPLPSRVERNRLTIPRAPSLIPSRRSNILIEELVSSTGNPTWIYHTPAWKFDNLRN